LAHRGLWRWRSPVGGFLELMHVNHDVFSVGRLWGRQGRQHIHRICARLARRLRLVKYVSVAARPQLARRWRLSGSSPVRRYIPPPEDTGGLVNPGRPPTRPGHQPLAWIWSPPCANRTPGCRSSMARSAGSDKWLAGNGRCPGACGVRERRSYARDFHRRSTRPMLHGDVRLRPRCKRRPPVAGRLDTSGRQFSPASPARQTPVPSGGPMFSTPPSARNPTISRSPCSSNSIETCCYQPVSMLECERIMP
jgi:hypothetical protein